MTNEKEPILTNSAVPFPSTAIAAEAAREDPLAPGQAAEPDAVGEQPLPALGLPTSGPHRADVRRLGRDGRGQGGRVDLRVVAGDHHGLC